MENAIRNTQLTTQHAPVPEQRSTTNAAASLKETSITQRAIDQLAENGRKNIEEEIVLKLPSDSFDKFLTALDAPMNDKAIAMMKMEPEWVG